jgi:subtilase family serine protease
VIRFRTLGVAAATLVTLVALFGGPFAPAPGRAAVARTADTVRGPAPDRPPRASIAQAGGAPLGPAQLRRAYELPSAGAPHQTVAVVSAYPDRYAQADLNAYSRRYHLAPCTAAKRCFRVLNLGGGGAPSLAQDPDVARWVTESAISTELVHGICQTCQIVLVEARDDTAASFAAAMTAAGRTGATVIVSSFSEPEGITNLSYAASYNQARAAVVIAAGDAAGAFGYTGQPLFPASLPNVIAVGGTVLHTRPDGAYAGEAVWSGTVSGCSLYEQAARWQAREAHAVGCRSQRAVADVAAMAEPGAVVYIAGLPDGGGPWYAATGTSVSAPIIAAVIGLAGSAGADEARHLYAAAGARTGHPFHRIVSGENAPGCRSAICHGERGFNGPTGLGSPAGLAAFLPPRPRARQRRS